MTISHVRILAKYHLAIRKRLGGSRLLSENKQRIRMWQVDRGVQGAAASVLTVIPRNGWARTVACQPGTRSHGEGSSPGTSSHSMFDVGLIGRACRLALILTAHGLIAKLREREIEGARHARYLHLERFSCFGRIFVLNVAPLALAAGKQGFAEIHASAVET